MEEGVGVWALLENLGWKKKHSKFLIQSLQIIWKALLENLGWKKKNIVNFWSSPYTLMKRLHWIKGILNTLFSEMTDYFSVIFWVRSRNRDLTRVRSSFWVTSSQMSKTQLQRPKNNRSFHLFHSLGPSQRGAFYGLYLFFFFSLVQSQKSQHIESALVWSV